MRAFIAAALVAASSPALAATIGPTDAGKYVGQTVTVEGVASVYTPASGVTFVDLGGSGRNAPFTGFIPKAQTGKFPTVHSLSGKTVDVTGTVQMYQGKPEIVLTDPDQLKSVP